MKYFPVFLDLKNRKVVVVGEGPETKDKVLQILQTGARVYLINPMPMEWLAEAPDHSNLVFVEKYFSPSDLNGAWLVMSTSQDEKLNRYIVESAANRNIFYNTVDVTNLCSFIMPAIVERDDVSIAISTSGKSPALARKIKRVISTIIGPEYGKLNDLMGKIRLYVLQKLPDPEKRKKLFHDLVNSSVLETFNRMQPEKAEKTAWQKVEQTINESSY
jgi:precorrin-2 dehydrogenase / sirohydrochlorin ferrochelatase